MSCVLQKTHLLRPWMTGGGGRMMTKMATLTSYAHLVSLMKSSVWIIGFYNALASRTVTAIRMLLQERTIVDFRVWCAKPVKKIVWEVEKKRHILPLSIWNHWIKFIMPHVSYIWIMSYKFNFMSEMHPRQKFRYDRVCLLHNCCTVKGSPMTYTYLY